MTALFCLMITPSAVMNIVQPEIVQEMMLTTDLPPYLLSLVGTWKVLGILALAVPRFPRITEWAYAGFFFDLTGASWIHAAAGDTPGIVPPLVFVAVLLTSYGLRASMAQPAQLGDLATAS